jgi:hypothetical protein
MKRTLSVGSVVVVFLAAQLALAIDYKKNVISGGGGTNQSTFSTISTRISFNGTNTTSVTSGSPMAVGFGDLDWTEHGFGKKTLDQRILMAEQQVNRLYFIRDVCPKLEDEIKIEFEKKDIQAVLDQVSDILGTKLPVELPEGNFLVDKSDVSGMPADRFLSTAAQVCGLTLTYEKDRLVFKKLEKKSAPK